MIRILLLCSVFLCAMSSLNVYGQTLQMEGVMTVPPSQETPALTSVHSEALSRWIFSSAMRLLSSPQSVRNRARSDGTPVHSLCVPAISSTISGEFRGWAGDTIFTLDNGQIWVQAEHAPMRSYAFRPDVTIYDTAAGCRLRVADEDETVLVVRVK